MAKRTWRDGYVPGKAKKTVHLDDEVARALEVKAAEERVSQAEIVERALRRELGMVQVTINILDVEDATKIGEIEASLVGSDTEMIDQAIKRVEELGYTVSRDHCEVTEYSDGTTHVAVTVERDE